MGRKKTSRTELILNRGLFAKIDEEDFSRVSKYTWYVFVSGSQIYARTTVSLNGVRRGLFLHRFLLNPDETEIVDHINGNGLDNRRCNLRIVSRSVNARNWFNRPAPASGAHYVYKICKKSRLQGWVVFSPGRVYKGFFKYKKDALDKSRSLNLNRKMRVKRVIAGPATERRKRKNCASRFKYIKFRRGKWYYQHRRQDLYEWGFSSEIAAQRALIIRLRKEGIR